MSPSTCMSPDDMGIDPIYNARYHARPSSRAGGSIVSAISRSSAVSSSSSSNFSDSTSHLLRKQIIVKNLIHAQVCMEDIEIGGGCSRCSKCYVVRTLASHVSKCDDPTCVVPNCSKYKKAASHLRGCWKAECKVCAPAREELKTSAPLPPSRPPRSSQRKPPKDNKGVISPAPFFVSINAS